jgi:hypothetical protein
MTAATEVFIPAHRFTFGKINEQPIRTMLQGQTVDILYSSPPWDDAHVMMAMGRRYSFATFFHTFCGIAKDHVDGWVFVEVGESTCDAAARLLSFACKDVAIFPTTYGPLRSRAPARLLVGNTRQKVGRWKPDPAWVHGGSRQPRGIIGSVSKPGQILLDPCCTNTYQAAAALKLQLAFYGNDHNPRRAGRIRQMLEAP